MGLWVVSTFLSIMNNVAVNIHVSFSRACGFSFLSGMYLGVELPGLGHVGVLWFPCSGAVDLPP